MENKRKRIVTIGLRSSCGEKDEETGILPIFAQASFQMAVMILPLFVLRFLLVSLSRVFSVRLFCIACPVDQRVSVSSRAVFALNQHLC